MTSLALALVYGLGNEMRPVNKATSKTWQERGERGRGREGEEERERRERERRERERKRGRGCAGLLIEIYKMTCLPPKVELGIG